jgi:hypothetical protein
MDLKDQFKEINEMVKTISKPKKEVRFSWVIYIFWLMNYIDAGSSIGQKSFVRKASKKTSLFYQ